MTFSDYAEIAPGLFVGGHPEPEDPFDLGATVVVCLTSGTSVRAVPRDGVLVHWPIKDGRSPIPARSEVWPSSSRRAFGRMPSSTSIARPA